MTRNYTYSREGDITTKDTKHGAYTYEYDNLYRLTDAVNPNITNETYTYDNLGNRLSSASASTWLYNRNNELESYDGTMITHDDNGNITEKKVGTVDTTYDYDVGDRMEKVTDDSGNDIAAYYYDPFGRRLWKNTTGTNGRIYYLYSDEGLIGEYDSNGNEIKTYGYAPGSQWGTNPLFQKVGNTYYWYHNDHQGTPQKITNSSGTVVWSAVYDSFGNATINIETITNNLRFPGQYYDTETGLHYNWNRYYDPETGRYMRVDPIGEGLNLYLYTKNNPIKYIDPEGLKHVIKNSDESQNYTNSQSPEPKPPSLQADNQTSNDSNESNILTDGGREVVEGDNVQDNTASSGDTWSGTGTVYEWFALIYGEATTHVTLTNWSTGEVVQLDIKSRRLGMGISVGTSAISMWIINGPHTGAELVGKSAGGGFSTFIGGAGGITPNNVASINFGAGLGRGIALYAETSNTEIAK